MNLPRLGSHFCALVGGDDDAARLPYPLIELQVRNGFLYYTCDCIVQLFHRATVTPVIINTKESCVRQSKTEMADKSQVKADSYGILQLA